jgi:hypothetical protein
MINRFVNLAMGQMIRSAVSHKIREGSIKAVRTYILAVKTARMVTMGAFALGVVASLLVTGLVLVIVGLIGLAPAPENLPVVFIATGIVLAILAGIVMWAVFSESRWLKLSRTNELMDLALNPWPGMLPPNPLKAMQNEQVAPPSPGAQTKPSISESKAHVSEPKAVEKRSVEPRELEYRQESLEEEEDHFRRGEFAPQV